MNTRSKFHLMARAGYGARGIVFLLIAGLALFSSFAGGTPDTNSALTALLQQPFGRVWIGLIGLGLAGTVQPQLRLVLGTEGAQALQIGLAQRRGMAQQQGRLGAVEQLDVAE